MGNPANAVSLSLLKKYLTEKCFENGDTLFHQNDHPDGCYYLTSGQVDTFFFDADIQASTQMQTYTTGDLLGAIGLIDKEPRSVTSVANGSVKSWFISQEKLNGLIQKDLQAYHQFLRLAADAMSKKYRLMQHTLQHHAILDSHSPVIDQHVAQAADAQKEFLHWSEDRVDALIQDISQAINEQADLLAQKCVDESGFGVKEHKVIKIRLGSLDVAESLINKEGTGTLTLESPGVERISMPMGVIFGIIPITNPVETIVFKSLISLKSRNAIIISSHRKGRMVGKETVNIIRNVLKRHGAPQNLVQTPDLPASRKATNAFMKHDGIHFILATGGPSMVKSAYQSGTPAIGVGKGNAPVWVTEDANLNDAAHKIVMSKSFDNGIVCGSENNLLVDDKIYNEFIDVAEIHGAALLTYQEAEKILATAFPSGERLDERWVGRSAKEICAAADVFRHFDIKLILLPIQPDNLAHPALREKLAPILPIIRVKDDDSALSLAKAILDIEGKGHTAIIHSNSQERIMRYSRVVEVSRVLVNSAGTQGCIGAVNGLNLSWTLGCGTHGGGSTSDNVSYQHLQNTKRIAYI